jgi:intracellular septation protein
MQRANTAKPPPPTKFFTFKAHASGMERAPFSWYFGRIENRKPYAYLYRRLRLARVSHHQDGNRVMHFLLALRPIVRDFLSTILFVSCIWLTGNIVLSTGVGVGVGIVQTIWMLAKRRHIGPLQWLSLGLVLILGTTTILTHNGIFFKLKSSIIALVLALVTLRYEWMAPYLPPIITENLDTRTISRAGLAWAILLVAIALLNVAVAFTCSDRIWAMFIFCVPFASYCVLIGVQYHMFRERIAASIACRNAE